MNLAPIILFCYNRPDHLRKTLGWLIANKYASESILYVFCDGPKIDATEEQLQKIKESRKVVDELAVYPSFKEVCVIKRDENLGLGTSIITGVTEIINKYGKSIVLEDDLETSPFFLSYMNQCLEHYENRKSVFSISSLSRPHPERFYPQDYPYDVYCSLTHHPTGWATWKDRWEQVDWTASAFDIIKEQPAMIDAFCRMEYTNWEELIRLKENNLNLWSLKFALSHFINNSVSICPIVSYINHIGWDSEGTNAIGGGQIWFNDNLSKTDNIRFCDILYLDKRIINSWYSFTINKRRNNLDKIRNWFGRKFLGRDEFALKGKVFADF